MTDRLSISQNVNGRTGQDNDFIEDLVKQVPAASPKPSLEADYLSDVEELRAPPESELAAGPDFDTVTVRKPKKNDVIFVHPEWRFEAFMLMPAEGEKEYTEAVLPAIARRFKRVCRRARLVPYADSDNNLYLWVIVLEDASGKLNDYSDSALKCIRKSAGKWCRYEADTKAQRYRYYLMPDKEPPEWPSGGMADLVKVGFRESTVRDAELVRSRQGRPGDDEE